jgi:hypothetical protein
MLKGSTGGLRPVGREPAVGPGPRRRAPQPREQRPEPERRLGFGRIAASGTGAPNMFANLG